MKRIIGKIAVVAGLVWGLSGCIDTFLDLNPQDERTDAIFFKKASDFKEYAASCYSQLAGWSNPLGSIYDNMDVASDLMVNSEFSSELGHGTLSIPSSDTRWGKNYEFIRTANLLFTKVDAYPGNDSEIAPYVSEVYFFRAYAYFNLLKTFGGVPIVLSVLDTDSPELYLPRNSRYEVVNQILSDLQLAIDHLPIEQEIASADKGHISKWAAMAFKARVLLYEATWRRYNKAENGLKVITDFEGSAGPERDQIHEFLEESARLSKEVMDKGGYTIWNHNGNDKMPNQSNLYLFNLEDASCNPAGYTKESNNEFILYSVYDFTYRQGGQNLSHTVSSMFKASRKLMDLFLCTDGLPVSKSSQFKGYKKFTDEFINRDLRMINYISGGVAPNSSPDLKSSKVSGYSCYKFVKYGDSRKDREESANYPIIRLSEVYLNYAEAYYERYGQVDASWLKGMNEIRERAGVAPLTQQLITAHGLDPLTEIRRERTLELFVEGFRFDDLKRWGIAERELNASRCGAVVSGENYATEYVDINGAATAKYQRNMYPFGEEEVEIETVSGTKKYKCIVIDAKSNFHFAKNHYLWAIPKVQIERNVNLKQNPGYK